MAASVSYAALLAEQLVQKTNYYMVPLQGLVICLIAMPQYRPAQHARAERQAALLLSGADAATAQFRTQTGCDVLTAISPVSFGVDSVRMAFRRTVDMLQYHRFFGQTGGIVTPPVQSYRKVVHMPLELSNSAEKAANLMSVQQYEGFQQTVRAQLEAIRDPLPASLQQYKIFCFHFMDILSSRLVQGGMGDPEFLSSTDLYWLIDQAADFTELCRDTLSFLDTLTAPWRDSCIRQRQQLADSMREYILRSYTDPNLNVTAIAAAFHMSQPSFSAYFKKRTGISPQSYLSQQRLKHAIHLLRTTELTLPAVAEQSGFGSVSTMHRLIRQEMSMSPAQIRQMQG